MEFYEEQESTPLMHPALDVINDTLYVTVRALVQDRGAVNVVVDSNGKTHSAEDWCGEMKRVGLISQVDRVNIGLEIRWNMKSLGAFTRGELTAPNWQKVYNEIYTALDDYLVVCNKDYLTTLTLFVMMTYLHPIFDVLPLLWLRGPVESGKSRAADVIAELAFNANIAGSCTTSTLFRRAHEGRYTQIITEADHLAGIGSGDALSRQIQAGCRKSEARVEVSESSKDKIFTPTTYHTFVPRVLLSTAPFKSHPLVSRCIRLDILKVAGADNVKLSRSIKNADKLWSSLRDNLYRLQLMCFRDAISVRDEMVLSWKGTKGRTRDKWFPLAVIASLVSENVLDAVTRMAIDSQEEQQQDAEYSFEGAIFKFTRYLVMDSDREMTVDEMYKKFCDIGWDVENETPSWAKDTDTTVTNKQLRGWVKGKMVLARDMKRLGLIPHTPHKGRDCNRYVLNKTQIDALVATYLGH